MSSTDKRISPDLPKRVLFLNDVSFQYGAGIAQARQVEAVLSLGIEAGVLAWAPGDIPLEAVATRPFDPDLWLGIRDVDHLEGGKKLADDAVIAGLLAEVARFDPEVVIVGNLHAARWPFQLLPALSAIGCRVAAFLHDAYLFTGRCAYPGHCQLYLTGCDHTCPTATHYPALEPARIGPAWRVRREIFGGPHGLEVIANSRWNQQMFRTALPAAHSVEPLELGADERVFCPGDKLVARKELGLPLDRPIVLCAAVNFQEERKGGRYLREIVAAMGNEVHFAAFGHNAQEVPGLIGLGYHLRADRLALIYQAADIFLGTATEEAFGQTVMEAQLCGLPVVAFQAGGVVEIVRHEITGRLVPIGDVAAATAALRDFLRDSALLKSTGQAAREHAVLRFSLPAHAARWARFFRGEKSAGLGPRPAVLAYPQNEAEDLRSLERHRPSWPERSGAAPLTTEEIAGPTAALPGAHTPGEVLKFHEMGYEAGDVILELGSLGGRAAVTALRGARANPARTVAPQYFGVTTDPDALARTREALLAHEVGHLCHLFQGSLAEFFQRWRDVRPTMVVIDPASATTLGADLAQLSASLPERTPVLLRHFLDGRKLLRRDGVRRAALEWSDGGQAAFMGCFGCSALYVTVKSPQ
ncbi:MAG: hypothetical protein C0518_00565 [Opitutus sp.]|nr:hypothetical protein [Opitutus sp.]